MMMEGRRHGTVLNFTNLPHPQNPKAAARILSKMESSKIVGIFVKIPAKPTHHSKFTGNGNSNHPPAGKSKNKCKGTQKIRSSDAALNYKLISWRVMSGRDSGPQGKMGIGSGYSGSRILDELDTRDHFDNDEDDDDHTNDDGHYCG